MITTSTNYAAEQGNTTPGSQAPQIRYSDLNNKKTNKISYFLCLLIAGLLGVKNCEAQSTPYFTTITAGASHVLAIKNNGTLWGWGKNGERELGDGTITNRNSPVQIGSDTNWVTVSGGQYHSLAISADGGLWTWGMNNNGQLGNGSITTGNIPARVGTDSNWLSVAGGGTHSLGITKDGRLWAWGGNHYGQLGDSSTIDKYVPTQIGTATNWISISSEGYHSLGITSDGKLWAWGWNSSGQLGDGTNNDKNVPTRIGSATNWVSISAGGGGFSVGLTADGKLWGWGTNNYGQLGDGTTNSRNTPVQIGTGTNWRSVYAGAFHILGITANGKLWACGFNYYGQLGDNSTSQRNGLVPVGSASNWVIVSAGGNHSVGVTADAQPWAWGYNTYGSLGDGGSSNINSPEQAPSQTLQATGLAGDGSTATMQQGEYNIYSSGGAYIASVGNSKASLTPIVGAVTAKLWVDATQPAQYVKRHYQITPAINASTVTGRPTFYFTQAEFDSFNAVNTTKLPTSSSDTIGISHLSVEKRSGVSSDGSGSPNTYPNTTAATIIHPATTDIVWNVSQSRWEITFDVTGFSGFFIKGIPVVLPLKLISFSVVKLNNANHLEWTTTNQVNTKEFKIEWCLDAISWKILNTVNATSNITNTYSYNQRNEPSGKIFYRLKMLDLDGQFTYSNIIWLNGNNYSGIVVYPNPVKNVLRINTDNSLLNTKVALMTIEGKLIKQISITSNQQATNVQQLPSGEYLLKFSNGATEKFIKN